MGGQNSFSKVPLLSLFFFIGWSVISVGQLSRSTSEVLSRTSIDNSSLPYSSNIDFLENEAGHIPIVESYEFRTEMNEFDFNQQEYLMRFDLNSNEERKAYDRVLASNKKLYSLKQDEYKIELIGSDYEALIDYYFDMTELELIISNISIVNDKKRVLSKLLSNSDKVDVGDWLSNQDDLVSLMSDSISLNQSLIDASVKLYGEQGRSQRITFDDLISIDVMKEVVANLPNSNPIGIEVAEVEEGMAKAEYDMEEAETNKWLQYVQLRYKSDSDVSFQKEFSFSSSINIPTKATNKAKRNEAALEVWDKKYDKLLEKEKSARSYTSNVIQMESAVVQYNNLQKIFDSQELEKTYENYLTMGNVSPLILLEIKENIIRHKLKLLDAKKNIYEAYLDLISTSSLIITEPRRNYLSNNLEVLK